MTTGEAGFRTQARSLANAVFAAPREMVAGLKPPWDRLPAAWTPAPLEHLDPKRDRPAPPWPDVLISCGRGTAALSMAIRKASGGRTLTVQIQDPLAPADRFDLVVAMAHDTISGPNVVKVATALHDVTGERLADAAAAWSERMPAGSGPLVGVILGDPTRGGRAAAGEVLLAGLRRLRAGGARLAIVASRRTPEAVVAGLRDAFSGDAGVLVWDRQGDNPYLGTLALADRLVVTSDSVSMISEALATAHPVEVFGQAQNARHRRFLAKLQAEGQIAPFSGGPPPPRSTQIVSGLAVATQAVRALLAARTGLSA
ncbi:MAG TPA: mitochondrial fission ELM1 family protein [Caulobacteraceae bacterium]|nr:mitochondrial fission ELM1 family protein [Caulobacteraceae bacterium]